eukprot:c7824_g1_i1.p1 GENE.c7824_g1_i1~~c7824_g1_i1.p1  ORF type:complete len:487 (-),score=116.77 c7824_g1_i1:29-1489(-)
MSALPWLGMDENADQDLELLMAFSRHRETAQAQLEHQLADMNWTIKIKNVIMGETIQSKVRSGMNLGESLRLSYSTMRQQNTVICVLSLCGLLMQICEVEILFSKNNETNPVLEGMKAFVTLSTILSVLFLIFWYRLYYDQKRHVNAVLEGDTFWSSDISGWFIIEVLVLSVHAPPGLLFTVQASALDPHTNMWRGVMYSSDELIVAFMFLRFYVLFRAIMQTSGLQDEKAQAVSTLYQEQIEGLFIVKKFVYTQPLMFLSMTIAVLTFTFSYWLLIFERAANDDLSTAMSCMWLVVTTMTKTGFGDIYPRSLLGRFAIVVSCGAALFLVTCCTIAMFTFVQPTNRQLKLIQAIEKTRARRQLSNAAAAAIQRFWRKWRGQVYDPSNKQQLIHELPAVAQELRAFRETRKNAMQTAGEGYDMVRTELLDFRNDLQDKTDSFEKRLERVDAILQAIAKKFEKYVVQIDSSIKQIDELIQGLEKRRAF